MKTRKRLLALLLAMLLLFSLLPAYAAAEPDTSEAGDDENAPSACEHVPGEAMIENVVTPGCTEPGSHDVVVYCSLCEKELSRETVEDPAGHQSEDVEAVASTCKTAGHTAGKKCSVCDDILEGCEALPLSEEHTPGEPVTENEVKPGCTEPGSHDAAVYCSVCGKELSRESVEDPAPGHKSEDVEEVPAEVGKPGTAAGKKCSVCGVILEGCTEIPALPVEEAGDEAVITIKTQPVNAPIAAGEALFSVEAGAAEDAELQYRWQKLDDSAEYKDEEAREAAWEDIEGETGSTLRLTGLTGFKALEDAAPFLYRCVVTAGEVSVTTKEAGLALEKRKLESTVISSFAELDKTEYTWEDDKPTLPVLQAALPEELDVLVGGMAFFTEDTEGGALLLAAEDTEKQRVPVVWNCLQNYDENQEVFDFVPVPEDEAYTLADGLSAPDIKAHVGELYFGPVGGVLPDNRELAPIVGDGSWKSGLQKRGQSNDYYNAYEDGQLPPIRDQKSEGACWAFAALGAIEADMIQDGRTNANINGLGLSESHLAYYVTYDLPAGALRNGKTGDYRTFSGNYLNHGGNSYVAEIVMQNGMGLVWENAGNYSASFRPSGSESRAAQLTGAYYINPTDMAGIKAAIRAHGGVYCSIYMDQRDCYSSTYNSYYYPHGGSNHAVMLVGWDDSFPKEHFYNSSGTLPAHDGAWLVRNSWGGAGENKPALNTDNHTGGDYCRSGYFWMSYDEVAGNESNLTAFDTEQGVYDYCYAYDPLPFPSGTVTLDEGEPMKVVFTAAGSETVTAVGFESDDVNLHGSITVSCGGASSVTQVSTSYEGYYVFPLSEPVAVSKGAEVTVTLRFPGQQAGIALEWSGDTASYGDVIFRSHLDKGFTDSTGSQPYDPRVKLYTKNGSVGGAPEATGVTLSQKDGSDLQPVAGESGKYTLALQSGESVQLTAAVQPAGASQTVIWRSSDPNVAKVDNGLVMGSAPGTAVITAAALNGRSATCTVTVTGVSVDSVTITKNYTLSGEKKVLLVNEQLLGELDRDTLDLSEATCSFPYEILPLNAGNKEVLWTGTNPEVFEVDAATGTGRFRGNGTATVTVTAKDTSKGTKSDCVEVTIDVGTCTVSYNANGGEGAPASQTKDKYFPIALSNVTPTRAGDSFLGWATSNATNAPIVYQPGGTFKGNKNTTLYAVWASLVRIPELAGQGTVSVDGVSCPVSADGSISLPKDAKIIEAFTFQNSDSTDPHQRYPTGMKVWRVTKDKTGRSIVTRLSELDNVLQYSGFSIRISGNPGIRMITSVPTDKKSALMAGKLAGYTLEEDGALIAWADAVGDSDMTLSSRGVRSAYAYKKGVSDPVFNTTGNLTQYTNVLVDFNNKQVPRDLAMRSYMILKDKSGQRITLYGGQVQRSIGYVAYQNRNAFAPGSDSYNYVWNLIHVTYGSKYDKEYKQ